MKIKQRIYNYWHKLLCWAGFHYGYVENGKLHCAFCGEITSWEEDD